MDMEPRTGIGTNIEDDLLFDRIASNYVTKDLYKPSRRARKLRLFQTLRKIKLKSNHDILEIGCGAGFAATYLRGYYRNYVGIDNSTRLIDYAKDLNRYSNAFFFTEDLYHFSPEKSYDLIFMVGILHHLADIQKAVKITSSYLKPGGFFVVNEPQPSNPLLHILRKIRAKVDSHYADEQCELDEFTLKNTFQKAGLIGLKSYPQGIFSTPFAEVVIKPEFFINALSRLVCHLDYVLEKKFDRRIKRIAWNIVVAGRKKF